MKMQFTVHITYYRKIVGNISIEKNRTSFYSNKKYSQKIKLKNECTLREQNKERKKERKEYREKWHKEEHTYGGAQNIKRWKMGWHSSTILKSRTFVNLNSSPRSPHSRESIPASVRWKCIRLCGGAVCIDSTNFWNELDTVHQRPRGLSICPSPIAQSV